ncbi:DNA-processing protein DprA [Pedobacter sp. SYSU D00535]|uniref:DNA-processing protein DprA n=1 Tax=Pedobacter sp. SYSU D00535 TaxID=2810308 RepID=UPI001A96F71B|nr:DNA-processing protein DprA [Pedobacter sp. SYSU D00535]
MSLLHKIALTLIPGVGSINSRLLLKHFGTPEDVFSASIAQLTAIPCIGEKTARSIQQKDFFARAEKELDFIDRYKINVFYYDDEEYPKRLRNCSDAPLLLYYKGSTELNKQKVVSIVGTRNATSYGKELTQQLVEDLKSQNVLVVSGLAHGIDGIAHKACLKNEVSTIGVVGHGLDRIYPAQHRSLAEKMLANGGLLTEFPSETVPDRENFPKRNRIVAGMSDATIIVEASITGGALITAELANSYNRDVFAYPGRINDEYSAGCNHLIKTNRANLITGIKDLGYLLGWDLNRSDQPKQATLSLNLTDDERVVVDVLSDQRVLAIDDLMLATGWPQSRLAVTILALEMQGIILSLPGKTYKLA